MKKRQKQSLLLLFVFIVLIFLISPKARKAVMGYLKKKKAKPAKPPKNVSKKPSYTSITLENTYGNYYVWGGTARSVGIAYRPSDGHFFITTQYPSVRLVEVDSNFNKIDTYNINFSNPYGVDIRESDGNFFISSDEGKNKVYEIDSSLPDADNDGVVDYIGKATLPHTSVNIAGMAYNPDNQHIYVTSRSLSTINEYSFVDTSTPPHIDQGIEWAGPPATEEGTFGYVHHGMIDALYYRKEDNHLYVLGEGFIQELNPYSSHESGRGLRSYDSIEKYSNSKFGEKGDLGMTFRESDDHFFLSFPKIYEYSATL